MIRDPGQDLFQIGFRIDAIELCRSDQAVDGGGGALSSGIRSSE
jgi:hypothetical protein